MAVSGIRRRLKLLEDTGLFSSPRVCRPLTSDEIEALIKKLRQGTRLDLAEVASLEQRTPLAHGEYGRSFERVIALWIARKCS
jgi:hypothetical protein